MRIIHYCIPWFRPSFSLLYFELNVCASFINRIRHDTHGLYFNFSRRLVLFWYSIVPWKAAFAREFYSPYWQVITVVQYVTPQFVSGSSGYGTLTSVLFLGPAGKGVGGLGPLGVCFAILGAGGRLLSHFLLNTNAACTSAHCGFAPCVLRFSVVRCSSCDWFSESFSFICEFSIL